MEFLLMGDGMGWDGGEIGCLVGRVKYVVNKIYTKKKDMIVLIY